jgi:plasmid stabilization system protein ParE
MNAIARPLFLVDVEEAADYLFTEAGETIAIGWRDELKRALKLVRDFPEIGRLRSDLPSKISAAFR